VSRELLSSLLPLCDRLTLCVSVVLVNCDGVEGSPAELIYRPMRSCLRKKNERLRASRTVPSYPTCRLQLVQQHQRSARREEEDGGTVGRQRGAARPAHATVCRSPCALRCPVASGHGSRDNAAGQVAARLVLVPLPACAPDGDERADEGLTPGVPAPNPRPTGVRRMWPRKVPKSKGWAAWAAPRRAAGQNWARAFRRGRGRMRWGFGAGEVDMLRGMRVRSPGARGQRVEGSCTGHAGQTAARCCSNHGAGRRRWPWLVGEEVVVVDGVRALQQSHVRS
jgi:hypothetical protein